jgi:hypothetical protein
MVSFFCGKSVSCYVVSVQVEGVVFVTVIVLHVFAA